MNRIHYILSFLLIAGVASAQAQQPIVKINSPESSSAYSSSTECDVTAAVGDPIFKFGTTGNVLVTGTLSGGGCGGSTGTTASFGFNPPAAGLTINGASTASVGAGSVASVPFTYQAYYASSCSVQTSIPSGTCPAISASNGSCAGSGTTLSCAPAGATLSIPTVAKMGTNTSCNYTATATCAPGSVPSSATLTVTNNGGSGGTTPPAACSNLAAIKTSSGGGWSRVLTTSVKYGDGTVKSGADATSYVAIWDYPGTTVPWPGNSGLTTRPSASVNQYFAEQFTVPTDGSVTGHPNWAFTGSGTYSNASISVGICPGDFGQTGTQLTTGCKVDIAYSTGGLTTIISASQVGSACTLTPGGTYYLNLLPMAHLPVSDVSTSSCSGTCAPWFVMYD